MNQEKLESNRMKKLITLICLTLFLSVQTFGQCNHPDYDGLMELYNATGGPNWTNNTGWKEGAAGTNCDPCGIMSGVPWYRISCDINGRVTAIGLENNQLTGSIPNFSSLSKLMRLSLRENNLAGPIPNFSSLPNLEWLRLWNNQLTDSIPDFSSIPNLSRLELSQNKLTGSIPDFSNLSELEQLALDNNQISGAIPDFTKLPKLSSLILYNNKLSGAIPDFTKLPELYYLMLLENHLTGSIPEFSNLPNFSIVDLRYNKLSGCYPDSICRIQNFNSSNNPLLPWQGDHTKFCEDSLQTGAPCDDGDPLTLNDKIQEDCSCAGTDGCSHPDYDALMELYNATEGDQWANNSGWKEGAAGTNCDPCGELSGEPWYGVRCDGNNRVDGIDLDGNPTFFLYTFENGNNLNGKIPDLNLPFLEFLSIASNYIYGEIPNFTYLKNLSYLIIRNNQVSGNIPDFSSLPKLEFLWLSNNQVSGNIPDFGNIHNLTSLDLRDNNLSGKIPNFSNFFKLDALYLSNNQLVDTIPDFDNLPILADLYLNNNQLSGTIPNFHKLPNLFSLFLGNNKLSGTIPDFINFPRLTNMNLRNNQLMGTIPNFANLKSLSTLTLNDNQLSGKIPDFVNLPYPFLSIDLTSNQLIGCYPDSICKLFSFRSIDNPLLPWQGDHSIFCAGTSQIGAPCDDGNPDTENDQINEFCKCMGNVPCENYMQEINVQICPGTYYTYKKNSYSIGTYNDTISVTLGCDTIITLTVVEKNCEDDELIIETTIISPNSDGINDMLRFSKLDVIPNSQLSIYNRWGDRIYHKKDYTNDWDASGYPGGSYYYVLNVGEKIIKKNLTVIK